MHQGRLTELRVVPTGLSRPVGARGRLSRKKRLRHGKEGERWTDGLSANGLRDRLEARSAYEQGNLAAHAQPKSEGCAEDSSIDKTE